MDVFVELSKKLGFEDLRLRCKERRVVTARQSVFYYLKTKKYHETDIARLGNRSRADVIHCIKTFKNLLDVNDPLASEYWKLLNV